MQECAAAMSTHPQPAVAAGEILGELAENLSATPDLAVVFASGRRIDSLPEMVDAIHSLLLPTTLVATSASGTLGGSEQIERGDSFSVWAGSVGEVIPVRLTMARVGTEIASGIEGLPDAIAPGSVLMLVSDSASFDPMRLVELLESSYPGVTLVGGVASTSNRPGGNRMWLDTDAYVDGAVGVIFGPGIATSVLSQRDLALAIASAISTQPSAPTSSLVFTGNTRAINMFDEPDFVAQILTEFVEGPVAGMFTAGEFGPVAGQNSVHTSTASALLFGADSFGS